MLSNKMPSHHAACPHSESIRAEVRMRFFGSIFLLLGLCLTWCCMGMDSEKFFGGGSKDKSQRDWHAAVERTDSEVNKSMIINQLSLHLSIDFFFFSPPLPHTVFSFHLSPLPSFVNTFSQTWWTIWHATLLTTITVSCMLLISVVCAIRSLSLVYYKSIPILLW